MDQIDERELEIRKTYEMMGIGSAEARSQFTNFAPTGAPQVQFDVVVTTTSQPFAG